LRCLLGPRAANDRATVVLLALYGKSCADSGDLEEARAIADRLASMPPVLASSGITWPQVAMCSADLAFAVDHTELAQSVWRELIPHTGTGLVMSGAGYFGAADRSLGLLAAVIGTSDEASQLLHAAEAQEAHRGARAWEAQAMSSLDEIGGRGVRRHGTLVR
jgi:hypothetical protein